MRSSHNHLLNAHSELPVPEHLQTRHSNDAQNYDVQGRILRCCDVVDGTVTKVYELRIDGSGAVILDAFRRLGFPSERDPHQSKGCYR